MIREDKEVPSNRLNERTYVELPLLRQLQAQGWTVLDLPMHDQEPEDTGRSDAAEVILLPHPSPRNASWFRGNVWFEDEVVQVLRQHIAKLLRDPSP